MVKNKNYDKIALELVPKEVDQWRKFQGKRYWSTCQNLVETLISSFPEEYNNGTYTKTEDNIGKTAGITQFESPEELFIGFSCSNPYNLLPENSKNVVVCPTFDFFFTPNEEITKNLLTAALDNFYLREYAEGGLKVFGVKDKKITTNGEVLLRQYLPKDFQFESACDETLVTLVKQYEL